MDLVHIDNMDDMIVSKVFENLEEDECLLGEKY